MHELELTKHDSIEQRLRSLDSSYKEDSVQECVSAKMSKMYHEGEDKKLTREQMLGKAYGICRQKAKK